MFHSSQQIFLLVCYMVLLSTNCKVELISLLRKLDFRVLINHGCILTEVIRMHRAHCLFPRFVLVVKFRFFFSSQGHLDFLPQPLIFLGFYSSLLTLLSTTISLGTLHPAVRTSPNQCLITKFLVIECSLASDGSIHCLGHALKPSLTETYSTIFSF